MTCTSKPGGSRAWASSSASGRGVADHRVLRLRWLIEEYHKCLKSGCRVEERQLESADRLAPLIGMLCVVAVRLLQLKNDARSDPEAPAEHCVPADLVRTMARLLKVAEPRTLSVRRFVHEVAKRGGFLGRTGDGEPGYLTLWRAAGNNSRKSTSATN